MASFIDDICIYDEFLDQHLEHIDIVLSKLKEHGCTIKPSKAHLIKSEVEFLGYIVSADGLRPNPKKIESIMDVPHLRI